MKRNNKALKRKRINMCGYKSDTFHSSMETKKKKTQDTSNKSKGLTINSGQTIENKLSCEFNNESSIKKRKDEQKINANNKKHTEGSMNVARSSNKFLNEKNKTDVSNKNIELADVSRNECTGSNNWRNFLLQKGKNYVITAGTPGGSAEEQNAKYNHKKNCKLTKVIGMDCEMVGAGEDGRDNLLARVSIVNLFGDCLYDKFVKPMEVVTDYRTHVSGVRASDLKNADDFDSVQKDVADLIKNRILVGHAIKNDLEVLFLKHPRHLIRDTSKYFRKKGTGTPSLKSLAAKYLNADIQTGEHSSVQDAQAAVQLYNMYRKQWETGGGNRKNNRIDTHPNSS